MKQLDYNIHTHTFRCGHARGTDEEYVLAAIKNGFKVVGFSDHMMVKGRPQNGIRGDYSLIDNYISCINALKEKYKDQITILLGMECEYFPQMHDYYEFLLKEKGLDFLILGQHCYINSDDQYEWYFDNRDPYEAIDLYVEDMIKGMQLGLFSYVCHPDYFVRHLTAFDDKAVEITRRICEAAKKYDIPLEINLNGIRGWYLKYSGFHYPYPDFWGIVSEYGVRVTIGVDAHNPGDFDIADHEYAMELVNQYHLNLVTDYKDLLKK